MQADKKQLEILIMDYFRECYGAFPKGNMKPTESPDFTISMKNHHLLGVELTRLNPKNAISLDFAEIKIQQFREQFIKFTKDLFEQKSNRKLFVKFLFSDKKVITEDRKILVAVKIANLIQQHIQHRKEDSFFKESISKSQLPEGIEEVLIVHHPKLEIAVWERSNNLGVSNDVVDDIRHAIHKKDEKLRLYKKHRLNYYWLLVTTDRLRGVKNFNLSNKISNQHFESQFQHVFLFDLIKSEIYKLV